MNAHVFSILKDNLQTMFDKFRTSRLIFDEMSIRRLTVLEALRTGNHGSTSNIAHHALVFMLCGLYKKWKQPVTLYLIHGNTKVEMRVIFWFEVLDAATMQDW